MDDILFSLAIKQTKHSSSSSVRLSIQTVKNLLKLHRNIDLLSSLVPLLSSLQNELATVIAGVFADVKWKELREQLDLYLDTTNDRYIMKILI